MWPLHLCSTSGTMSPAYTSNLSDFLFYYQLEKVLCFKGSCDKKKVHLHNFPTLRLAVPSHRTQSWERYFTIFTDSRDQSGISLGDHFRYSTTILLILLMFLNKASIPSRVLMHSINEVYSYYNNYFNYIYICSNFSISFVIFDIYASLLFS